MSSESFLTASHVDRELEDYLPTQGTVFRTFGGYDSGFIGYGLETDDGRWFVKHAWHPQAVVGLGRARAVHSAVQHAALPRLVNSFEAPDGPGTVYAEVPHRLGDQIVYARVGWSINDGTEPPPLISHHGALSEQEMLVPLLWKRI